jgi:hypothetical protein
MKNDLTKQLAVPLAVALMTLGNSAFGVGADRKQLKESADAWDKEAKANAQESANAKAELKAAQEKVAPERREKAIQNVHDTAVKNAKETAKDLPKAFNPKEKDMPGLAKGYVDHAKALGNSYNEWGKSQLDAAEAATNGNKDVKQAQEKVDKLRKEGQAIDKAKNAVIKQQELLKKSDSGRKPDSVKSSPVSPGREFHPMEIHERQPLPADNRGQDWRTRDA